MPNEFVLHGESKTDIVIFDLDDTLIKTDAKVKVVSRSSGAVIKELTAEEFNEYIDSHHNMLDFEQFEDPEILRQGVFIHAVLKKLRSNYSKKIPVAILTARSSARLIRDFFLEKGIDIHPDLIIATSDPASGLTGSVAERKLQAIHRLHERGFKNFTFFDDNEDNLRLSKAVELQEGVKIALIVVEDEVPRKFTC